eukprot:7382721-Prymnesium_polylepis.1
MACVVVHVHLHVVLAEQHRPGDGSHGDQRVASNCIRWNSHTKTVIELTHAALFEPSVVPDHRQHAAQRVSDGDALLGGRADAELIYDLRGPLGVHRDKTHAVGGGQRRVLELVHCTACDAVRIRRPIAPPVVARRHRLKLDVGGMRLCLQDDRLRL